MALSTVIFVGESREWLPEIVEKARKLKVGAGTDPATEVGPLISKESKKRVETLIEQGVQDGAKLLLDGRGVKVINPATSWCCYQFFPTYTHSP